MNRTKGQKGFAAIAAIFLVVILAAMGAFMTTFSSNQQITSAQDLLGTRAYWAARAGLEWGISKVAGATDCPAASTPLTFAFDGNVDVTVECSKGDYTEGVSVRQIFRLTSIASAGTPGSVGRVERSVSASYAKDITP